MAKAINEVVANRRGVGALAGNAWAGGSLAWIYARTEMVPTPLVRLLADYRHATLRYVGGEVVEDVDWDAG